MGMKNTERQYIEYRPNLGMRADIMAIIETTRSERQQPYSAPTEILEALEKPPCQVLEKAMDTLKGLDDFLDDLADNLQGEVSNGIPFQDYLANRGPDGDPHIVHAWEDHHALNPDGTLVGELFPLILTARENLVDKVRLLNDELITGDIEYDSLEDICHQNAKELEHLLRDDIANSKPEVLAKVKAQNELTEAISGAVEGIQTFLEDASHLASQTVNDLFRGDVQSIVEHLTDVGPEMLDMIERLSEIGFHQKADQTQDIKERMTRVKDSSDILHAEIKELSKLKLEAGKVIDWLSELDTDADESAVTELIDNTMISVDAVLDGYDAVIGDMHKANEMQLMQFEDVVDNLFLKENQRKQRQITKDIKKNFDYTDTDRAKQVSRFSENMGYRKGISKKNTTKKPTEGYKTQQLVREEF